MSDEDAQPRADEEGALSRAVYPTYLSVVVIE